MTTPNHLASDPESYMQHQDRIAWPYGDNAWRLASRFSTPGDRVRFDPGSKFKYAHHFGPHDGSEVAIIQTQSGRSFGIGFGRCIDNDGRITLLPPVAEDSPYVGNTFGKYMPEALADVPIAVIGEPWGLSGIGAEDDPVAAVLIDTHKTYSGNDPGELGEVQDGKCPFDAFAGRLRNELYDQYEAEA